MTKRSRIVGGQKLRKLLRKAPVEVLIPIRQAIAEAAEDIRAEAAEMLPDGPTPENPYATGELKRGIKVRTTKDGLTARIGTQGRNRPRHAHLVEFGTASREGVGEDGQPYSHPGTPARPFLFPALKRNRRRAVQRIRRMVNRALATMGEGGDV